MATSLLRRVQTTIATRLSTFVRKFDINWFVNFQGEARAEDISASLGVGDATRNNAWVNIAVNFLAHNLSRAPFEIVSGDDVVTTGPVAKLFDFVNPYMSKQQLFEATQGWRKIKGEAFWTFDLFNMASAGEFPQSIQVIEPQFMTHKVDKDTQELSMWIYEKGNIKIPLMPNEIIHFRDWNPWDPWRGVPTLVAMGYELAQDKHANVANLNMLRNDATPAGILVPPDLISLEQALEVKQRWNQEHQGAQRRHTIAVLGLGVKYQQVQASIKDMEFFNLKRWNRQTVLARLGVPGVLVGAREDATPLSGSDTKMMMRAVWNNTLIPDTGAIQDKLDTDFFQRFKLDVKGVFNLDAIPELQEDKNEETDRDLKEVDANTMTINEFRDKRGRDPVPWGDTAYFPFAMQPWTDTPVIPPAPTERSMTLAEIIHPKALPIYTADFKLAHWKAVVKYWEAIEKKYTEEIERWLFAQRSFLLERLTVKIEQDIFDDLMEEGYWIAQQAELKGVSREFFLSATISTEGNLKTLFKQIGIPFDFQNWTIFNTGAIPLIDTRLTTIGRVSDTVRAHLGDALETAITDGLTVTQTADLIRDKYNGFKHHAETVARTELGGVIGDARIEGFKSVGIEKHEWSSAGDGKVRTPGEPVGNIYNHRIDGTVVTIGEPFPTNGQLLWPNVEGGAAGDVINCRCLTVPIRSE